MIDVLKEATLPQLYDLRDFINCSDEYDLDIKQQLMDSITDEMRMRQLEDKMKPLVQQFIKEREEKRNGHLKRNQ